GHRPHQADARRSLQRAEVEEIVDGAAGEHTAVRAPAFHDAASSRALLRLHARRVAAAREVDIGARPLVVIVEARNVRLYAVHRGHLKGRRGRRQADAHLVATIALTLEQLREKRRGALRERLVEHGARQSVDLDDQQPAASAHGCRPEAEATYQTVDAVLEGKNDIVGGHHRYCNGLGEADSRTMRTALSEATPFHIRPPAMEPVLRSHTVQHHATCDGSRSAKPRGSTSCHLRWNPFSRK